MKHQLANFVLKSIIKDTPKESTLSPDRRGTSNIMKDLVTKHSLFSRMIILIRLQNQSNDDIDFIREQTKQLPFFQKFFKDVEELQIRKICSQFKIETFQPLDVIIQQDDDSNDKMYVVVIGSVSVCVQGPGQINIPAPPDISANSNNPKQAKKMSKLYHKYGRPVHVIQAGQGFGELALQAKNKDDAKRKATIISISEVDCIVLDKTSYKSALQHTYEAEYKEKFIFAYFPFISDLSSLQQKQFYLVNFIEKFFSKGKQICQEGQKDDQIYILVKGTAQIFKNITIQEKDQTILQKVLLLDLGVGEMIGDEILFNDDCQYEYCVRVSSVDSVFYTVTNKIILNRFPSLLLENFNINYKLKKKLRDQRIEMFHQETQDKQKAEQDNNMITNQICDVNNKSLVGRMIPYILKQKTKMQLQVYDNVAIRQLENEQHEFDQHQTERLFKEHMKHKKQQLIMTYQAHQLRGRDPQINNTKDRYTQLVGVITSRTKTDDQDYIDKLMGDESDLICNVNTNKFFTINKYTKIPPLYKRFTPQKQERQDMSHVENQLDFGYMKDFDRQRKFKMIQLAVLKPHQDKKAAFSQLQESMGKIIHKYKKIFTSRQELKESQLQKTTDEVSQDLINDPYMIQDRKYMALQDRRKILMKKTRRINVVNDRIMKKYHSTEPSVTDSD